MSNIKEGNCVRVVNGKKYYYNYKQVMLKEDLHDKLKLQAYLKDMSIAKYIEYLLIKENGK